jgi:hypothetical protein
MDLDGLTLRVERLERENRYWKVAGICALYGEGKGAYDAIRRIASWAFRIVSFSHLWPRRGNTS